MERVERKSGTLRQELSRSVPSWMRKGIAQRAFTYLTGQSCEGEELPQRTQIGRLAQSFVIFASGILGGVVALPVAGPAGVVALLFAWVAAIGGARDLQLTIYHHCAHENVVSKVWSTRIGRIIDKLLLIERFEAYKPKHVVPHHGRHTVSTDKDPTVMFLRNVLRIEPGLPVQENKRRFLRALLSPRVHMIVLGARLKSQFVEGSWSDRLLAGGYLGTIAGVAVATEWWLPIILGWGVPLTVGYQMAQCARLVVEHTWPKTPAPDGKRDLAAHDELTIPVRCAVPPPTRWTLASTAAWSTEIAFNAVIRMVVLPGDSGPGHLWHHGEARGDWANHIRAAANWEAKRTSKGLPPTTEAWGYRDALRFTFESFAEATPDALEPPNRPALKRSA